MNMFCCSLQISVCCCCRAALVLPKAEKILQTSIQPYISSILEALMEPTSRGFSEVRDVFFRELVEISKNSLNGGGKEKLGDVSHVLLVEMSDNEVNIEGKQQGIVTVQFVFLSTLKLKILILKKIFYYLIKLWLLCQQTVEAEDSCPLLLETGYMRAVGLNHKVNVLENQNNELKETKKDSVELGGVIANMTIHII